MKRSVPHNSRWAERRSTVVYAVRAATFGSWRMLTLGAEYEYTWVQSPDRSRGTLKRVEEDSNPSEETDACTEKSMEPSWRVVHEDTGQECDTVLTLDGVSRPATRDGVRRAVWKHDTLNDSPLTQRCEKHIRKLLNKYRI
ncbi:hypothetical protein CHARACLAT_003976 [Characodon lateralis]|uniref:Uncharacterized protein n=1 Tax=Characodon lateralis TaxID=208331 RepID=A0ABU7DN73_9TELE|nr:hypothetical protein [Characodon lateralis]